MARRVKVPLAAVWVGAAVLAGCTLASRQMSAGAVRSNLIMQLDSVQQAQAAALALWDRVIFGEAVSCQEAIPVPEPVTVAAHDLSAYPQTGAIQARLNAAIQAVRDSSDLWNAECASEQPFVPLSTAREGRVTALAASAPLAEARQLLAAWPETNR